MNISSNSNNKQKLRIQQIFELNILFIFVFFSLFLVY